MLASRLGTQICSFIMSTTTATPTWEYQVGIDVSKDHLDCWLRPQGEPSRWANNQKGFERLAGWIRAQGCAPDDTLICLENTGIYGDRLVAALLADGWPTTVVKTTATEKVAPEHHRKDDRFDARLLAEYADRYADKITLATAQDLPVERLRQLFGERRRLVKARNGTLNRRSQTDHLLSCPELLTKAWEQQLAFYDQQIEAIEERMEELVASHEGINEYYQLLCSIPGVGPVTARLWLILFYGQQTLNFKKIASRFGFAPHPYHSGTSVQGRTRSSGHGQTQMRSCMPMVARVASTHIDRMVAYKERKREEGKPWPVIRNNLINKMIKIMCAIWNSRQPWDPEHVSQFEQQKKAA